MNGMTQSIVANGTETLPQNWQALAERVLAGHQLSKEEGLLAGTSSGANVFVALHMDNGRNKVVTILPDRVERYFSTALI